MEHWWNDTDGGKTEVLEEKPSPVPLVHHRCYTDWPGIEPGPWHRPTIVVFRPPVCASCALLRFPFENSAGRKLTDGLYSRIRNRFGNSFIFMRGFFLGLCWVTDVLKNVRCVTAHTACIILL
jgi:hypothetical protein